MEKIPTKYYFTATCRLVTRTNRDKLLKHSVVISIIKNYCLPKLKELIQQSVTTD